MVHLSEELTIEARRLAGLPESSAVRSDDPRFARLIRAVDVEAQTARELAETLLARAQDPPDPGRVAGQVRHVRERIECMGQLTMEEELIQIFASTSNERNAEILIGYYGWEDGRQHTLTEIGDRFGITRERIRQVCAKLTRKPQGLANHPGPGDGPRPGAASITRLPGPAAEIEAELRQPRLDGHRHAAGERGHRREAAGPARPSSAWSRSIPSKRNGPRLAVRADQVNAVLAIVDAAKKDVYFHGLATIERDRARRWPPSFPARRPTSWWPRPCN